MNLKLLNYRNCNLQRDRFSDNPTTNPQLLMIADESLITELTATILHAMNEQRTQAYLNLINQLLTCNNGYQPRIVQENQELLDEGLVQVMVAVAQQLEALSPFPLAKLA